MDQPDDERSALRVTSHESPDGSQSNTNGRPERATTRRESRGVTTTVARSWRFVLAGAVLGAVLGALVAVAVPDRYEASAYLVVTADADADVGTSPTAYAQVYSRIARQPAIMMETDPEADLGSFGQGITVTAFPDAPVIELTGRGDSAELATLRANTVAEAIADYSTGDAAVSGYEVGVVTPALVEGATAPTTMLPSVAAGLVLGVFAGLVLAMARPARNRRP
jgi:capsular polysaccharide biosynthesis protein